MPGKTVQRHTEWQENSPVVGQVPPGLVDGKFDQNQKKLDQEVLGVGAMDGRVH